MANSCSAETLGKIGITTAKRGDINTFIVKNQFATAEFSAYGAHVLSYTPAGKSDILWVSGKSNFQEGSPIRGGIPVCWPWFGPAAQPAHGKARIAMWCLNDARAEADGSTTIKLSLDQKDEFDLIAEMYINVGPALTVCLSTSNTGTEAYPLSEALHTYFAISEITKIAVKGLAKEDLPEPDFPGYKEDGAIRFERETDLVCQPGNKILIVQDDGWDRTIRVERFGSKSAVVWNPWIEKAQRMPDFGDEEYHNMVCVEAANAKAGTVILDPGTTHTIGTRISLV